MLRDKNNIKHLYTLGQIRKVKQSYFLNSFCEQTDAILSEVLTNTLINRLNNNFVDNCKRMQANYYLDWIRRPVKSCRTWKHNLFLKNSFF